MSRPLIVSVPHKFGRQEARRRLDAGVARLRPELSVFLRRLDYHWEDDTLKVYRLGTLAADPRPDRGAGRRSAC